MSKKTPIRCGKCWKPITLKDHNRMGGLCSTCYMGVKPRIETPILEPQTQIAENSSKKFGGVRLEKDRQEPDSRQENPTIL